jgi:hypothetical protein
LKSTSHQMGNLGQIMKDHPVAQVAAADPQNAGSMALIAFGVVQCPADQVPLGLGQGGQRDGPAGDSGADSCSSPPQRKG